MHYQTVFFLTLSRNCCAAILTSIVCIISVPSSFSADVLVSSRFSNNVLRYDGQTGAFVGVFAQGPELANPNGIAFGPDSHLYVGLGDGTSVLKYHGVTGSFLGEFITPGDGGLSSIRDIIFGPDGDLYVASGATDQVLRYDGDTGAFLGVAASGNGLDGPVGLAFGPEGRLFVGAALSNLVFVFNNGVFERSFNAGATHSNAVGLSFNANGQLLVAQSVTNEILAFDPATGNFQGVFAAGPPGTPIYMEISDSGLLHVGAFSTDSVWQFDANSGAQIGQFISPGSGGLNGTHDIAFFPADPPAVVPEGRKLNDGVIVAGGLTELFASDDQYFELDPSPTKNLLKQKVHLIVQSTSPIDTPADFRFRLESAMMGGPSGDVIQTIELLNYDTGILELMDSRSVANNDESIEVTPAGDLSRFVQPVTKEITAEITWKSESFTGAQFTWSIDVDEAVWLVGQ